MVKRIEWIILALALGVIALFTANWAIKGAVHYQKDVTVPDLAKKSLGEAVEILSQHELGLKKESVQFDESVPAGTVLRQLPPAGALVREGKIVRVTLSQGSETVFVPELVGQSLRSAEIALRTNFLSLGEVRTLPSVKYEKDVVISQDPPAKKIVGKNALVHLSVSAGPPEDGRVLLPDFVGKGWIQVESWAKETSVPVERSDSASTAAAEPDTVVQQSIPPDTDVNKDTPIHFVVAGEGSGGAGSAPTGAKPTTFNFEVPQSESAKRYTFILLDAGGNKEIYRGEPKPGSKLRIPLPGKFSSSARVRILINGILTEERTLQ